jgi:hypothetical protein
MRGRHWGLAYCLWKLGFGNYNETNIQLGQEQVSAEEARAAADCLAEARRVCDATGATDLEKLLVAALSALVPTRAEIDVHLVLDDMSTIDPLFIKERNEAFAWQMASV